MTNSNTNIKFNYAYRDAAGYGNSGSVIFSNTGNIENVKSVETQIRDYLFDEEFFYPDRLSIPSLHFEKWNPELDHAWYYFESLEFTNEEITDQRAFDEFLSELKKFAKQSIA